MLTQPVVSTLNESVMSRSSNDSLCWLSLHRCGRSVLPQRTSCLLCKLLPFLAVAMLGGEQIVLAPQKIIRDLNLRRPICTHYQMYHDAKRMGKRNPPRCRAGAKCPNVEVRDYPERDIWSLGAIVQGSGQMGELTCWDVVAAAVAVSWKLGSEAVLVLGPESVSYERSCYDNWTILREISARVFFVKNQKKSRNHIICPIFPAYG